MATTTITLKVDGNAMRRAVKNLAEHCLSERKYFDRNGKGSTAEAFEALRVVFEESLEEPE